METFAAPRNIDNECDWRLPRFLRLHSPSIILESGLPESFDQKSCVQP